MLSVIFWSLSDILFEQQFGEMVCAWSEFVNSFCRQDSAARESTSVVSDMHELNSVDVGLVAHGVGSRDWVFTACVHRQCARLLAVKRPTV